MNKRPALFWKTLLFSLAAATVFAWLNLSHSITDAQALSGNGTGGAFAPTATASPLPNGTAVTPTPASVDPHASGDCYGCHSQPGMVGKLQNGETISLTIDASHYQDTVHSSCVFCHGAQKTYPHQASSTQSCTVCHWDKSGGTPPANGMEFNLPFADARAVSLSINDACRQCHEEIFNLIDNNVHSHTMAVGNRNLPACVDCHGLHNIQKIDRKAAAQICAKCHKAEYIAYSNSVHGAALLSNNNQDVPVCDDCHGYHQSKGTRDSTLRIDAYETCGKCHADKQIMDKYGISTAVLSTYLDDFHGRSADLFGQPGGVSNVQATCYDCHGVHNILPPGDPNSKVSTANLQATCRECHADASASFPQSWLSHTRPSLQTLPGLYLTNILLHGLVALVVVYFILYILLQLGKRFLMGEGELTPVKVEEGKK